MRLSSALAAALAAISTLSPSFAEAQQETIQYDSAVTDALAAITCGFCSGEKYGAVFYALGATGGLQPAHFPFTLDNLLLPIAPTSVRFDAGTLSFICEPRAESGMVGIGLEIYAGSTVPNTIDTQPTGAWPGETLIFGPVSASLEYSVEMPAGSGSWEVRLNTIPVGVTVGAPSTYVRVVVSVGTGGASESCSLLGLQPPDISPFRDNDGRVGARRNFIRELANSLAGTPERWQWTEDIMDPTTGGTINGDWLIRMQITPQGVVPPTDAGVEDDAAIDSGVADSGAADVPAIPDTGTPDSGVIADSGAGDTGAMGTAPSITSISPGSALVGDAADVTVVGAGFALGLTLRIGTTFAAVRQVAGSTTINATLTAPGVGTYDVVVTNPDGQSAILPMGFKVNPKDSVNPVPNVDEGGCGCTTAGNALSPELLIGLFAAALMFRRR